MNSTETARLIQSTIQEKVAGAKTQTEYRQPLVAFAAANDPLFPRLKELVTPEHLLPQDLLAGAVSVVSFFIPFAAWVTASNTKDKDKASVEWATAYIETNALIAHVTQTLINSLEKCGIRAAAAPATHNFDPKTLISRWGHKSVAVIAGLGSFGLHQQVITDAGCAGRFGSLALDAELPYTHTQPKERCLYLYDGSCQECLWNCPVGAIREDGLDKQICWQMCQQNEQRFLDLGRADVCGKCSTGICACQSPL